MEGITNANGGTGGGVVVGTTPPSNKKTLWIDTSDSSGNGIAKYYDKASGQWLPVAAIWG